jgi:hypothetical protein
MSFNGEDTNGLLFMLNPGYSMRISFSWDGD